MLLSFLDLYCSPSTFEELSRIKTHSLITFSSLLHNISFLHLLSVPPPRRPSDASIPNQQHHYQPANYSCITTCKNVLFEFGHRGWHLGTLYHLPYTTRKSSVYLCRSPTPETCTRAARRTKSTRVTLHRSVGHQRTETTGGTLKPTLSSHHEHRNHLVEDMATEIITVRETRRKYHWPEIQLNLWIFVMLAAAATVLGMFAWFITVQNQLRVGIPWYAEPSSSPSHSQTSTNTIHPQALHVRCRDRIPNPPLHNPNPRPRRPTNPNSRRHTPRLVHLIRPVAHRPDRDLDTTLRPPGECQRQLQHIRLWTGVHGRQCRDFGLVDAE